MLLSLLSDFYTNYERVVNAVFGVSQSNLNTTWLHHKNHKLCVLRCAGIVRIALSNMDREVRKDYQVVIQAKDMAGQMGGLSGTTVVNVTLTDVNDSPPRFAYSKTLAY